MRYVLQDVTWELREPIIGDLIFHSNDFEEFFGFLSENFLQYDHCEVHWNSTSSGLGIGMQAANQWVWDHEHLYD